MICSAASADFLEQLLAPVSRIKPINHLVCCRRLCGLGDRTVGSTHPQNLNRRSVRSESHSKSTAPPGQISFPRCSAVLSKIRCALEVNNDEPNPERFQGWLRHK